MEALLAFMSTPIGAALATAVAMGVLGVLFAVARKLNARFGVFARGSKNKIDDEIHKALADVLDAAEPAAKSLIKEEIKKLPTKTK